MSLLHVENLQVSIPTAKGMVHPVRKVSLQLQQGEMLALVGESGSGKSITAQAIMGLLPENAVVSGKTLQFERKKIAMIFQNPMATFNPVLTIGYQISEPLRVLHGYSKKAAEAEAIQLLERMQIRDAAQKMRRYAHEFSGGMLQRAAIAMALACKPQLLIADEPTTALDVSTQAEVMQLLAELRREKNIGILFITHDLALVAQQAERVAVMYRGEIIETGITRTVLTQPQHAYTKTLIAALPQASVSKQSLSKNEQALLIANLHKHFGKTPVLQDINLSVAKGEVLGLAGESGSGKSTLALCIAGLHGYDSGEIVCNDTPLLAQRTAQDFRQQAQHIQMVFQDPLSSINPRMTVADTLLEPLRLNRIGTADEQHAAAARWMERIGLRVVDLQRYPHSFSGGQLQRIGIARALISKPQLLICDEPVSALDVTTQAQILELLSSLRRELGLTLLFISHDLATMQRFCDRIAVMQAGKIVEQGSAQNVLENPQHAYTQKLVRSSPLWINTKL
jgi:peptide/nickel transport system ATP-binding protein